MSHRALVAVSRPDGGYDVSVARDGADDDLLTRLLDPGAIFPAGLLEGPRVALADTIEDVLADHLHPLHHEALLVVEPDGTATPHAVVPYVLGTGDGLVCGDPSGAVVSLAGRDGTHLLPAYVRGWHHGTTAVLGEAVDRGLVETEGAIAWLDERTRLLAGDQHAFAALHRRRG